MLVEEALKRKAPFMRAASWVVERRHFTAQTIKAAQAWREVIAGLGAEVVAAEEWLAGQWSGHCGARADRPDPRALRQPAAGGGLQAIEVDQSTQADAEGVRQPGEPVPRDAREWWAEES